MAQESFGALWDYAPQLQAGTVTLEEASNRCKQARDARYRGLKSQGYHVRRFTLRGQLRQYWSFGTPCGLSAPSFYIDYKEKNQ